MATALEERYHPNKPEELNYDFRVFEIASSGTEEPIKSSRVRVSKT